ncbi:MAG TPA: hypothetical protein VFE58_16085 [Tepidisphaeraceae bacterium]|nr:hypothetical protein [Tepidisphaeraceae bacterium]
MIAFGYYHRHPSPPWVHVVAIIICITVLILAILRTGFLFYYFIKRPHQPPPAPPPPGGFSLESLQLLHSQGKISDTEYQRAHDRILAVQKHQLNLNQPPKRPRPKPSKRLSPRYCPSCGYDLRATPTLCPECGKSFPKSPESSPQ